MSMDRAWSDKRRKEMFDKVAAEARKTAMRLGAEGCVVIAFFADGDQYHTLDAGRAPMPLQQLYEQMRQMHETANAAADNNVVKLQ